jgi:GTP-binding protein Era
MHEDDALDLDENHKSGYIAVVGKPNVGKSTLVNALIGAKVAITSPKPQTTRKRVLGILSLEDAQLLFVDTPGIHIPKRALGQYMMREVDAALSDCDAILFVIDITAPPDAADRIVAERIASLEAPKILALNKSDSIDPVKLVEHVAAYEALLPGARLETNAMLTSATRGDNLDKLRAMLIAPLAAGPAFYPADQVTDQTERTLAAEFVREQALRLLDQEVPHGVMVDIEEWKRRKNGVVFVGAVIYVERDSQKGILIGKRGAMLKDIGQHARREIERELGIKIFLELYVKVREAWRESDRDVRVFLGPQDA